MSLVELVNRKIRERDKALQKNRLYSKAYKLSYITGASAFNIPYKGMQCDWHQIDTLIAGKYGNFVMHPKTIIGVEDIFGKYGIWDCSDWLKERGFRESYLCATPIRAILDILYYWIVVKNKYPMPLDDFWDYMFDELNIDELCDKVEILKNGLTGKQQELLEQWRVKNEIYQ